MNSYQQSVYQHARPGNLAPAIAEAVLLWKDSSYANHLSLGTSSLESVEWFTWFLGEWNVARTIKEGRQQEVFVYLNTEFRTDLREDLDGSAIDRAAISIRDAGLSSRVGHKRVAGLPTSLVSKVAFLFDPSNYPPCDTLAKSGLNKLRGVKKSGGLGHLNFYTYKEFLAEFNRTYTLVCQTIREEVEADWVSAFAEKVGVSRQSQRSKAFKRKVLDNLLMSIGRGLA